MDVSFENSDRLYLAEEKNVEWWCLLGLNRGCVDSLILSKDLNPTSEEAFVFTFYSCLKFDRNCSFHTERVTIWGTKSGPELHFITIY